MELDDMKLYIASQIATGLYQDKLVQDTDVSPITDMILSILYNYSVIKIERTEIAVTEDEEFKEFCEFFVMKKCIAGLQKSSIETYMQEIVKFHEFIKKRMSEVTVEDIDMYLLHKRTVRKNSISTIHGARLNLSSFFNLLYRSKKIEDNPMDGVDSIKLNVTYELPLSKTEITQLEDSCIDNRDRAILTLFLESGIRIAECANLNIADIDFQKMEIFVRQGKGGKDRIVPLGEKSSHVLQQYLATERPDIDINSSMIPIDTPLFTRLRTPSCRLRDSGIANIIDLLGERAGIPRLHAHLLRKTYATSLYRQGIQINVIAKLLGHSNMGSVERYVVLSDTDVRAALNGSGIS